MLLTCFLPVEYGIRKVSPKCFILRMFLSWNLFDSHSGEIKTLFLGFSVVPLANEHISKQSQVSDKTVGQIFLR